VQGSVLFADDFHNRVQLSSFLMRTALIMLVVLSEFRNVLRVKTFSFTCCPAAEQRC